MPAHQVEVEEVEVVRRQISRAVAVEEGEHLRVEKQMLAVGVGEVAEELRLSGVVLEELMGMPEMVPKEAWTFDLAEEVEVVVRKVQRRKMGEGREMKAGEERACVEKLVPEEAVVSS